MNDKEFILEAIKRLLPTTEWYGETHHDDIAYSNLDLYYDILKLSIDKIVDNYYTKQEGNGSADALSRKSKEVLEDVIYEYLDIIGEVVDKLRKENE